MIYYKYFRFNKLKIRSFDNKESAIKQAFEDFETSYCCFVGLYDKDDTQIMDIDSFLKCLPDLRGD